MLERKGDPCNSRSVGQREVVDRDIVLSILKEADSVPEHGRTLAYSQRLELGHFVYYLGSSPKSDVPAVVVLVEEPWNPAYIVQTELAVQWPLTFENQTEDRRLYMVWRVKGDRTTVERAAAFVDYQEIAGTDVAACSLLGVEFAMGGMYSREGVGNFATELAERVDEFGLAGIGEAAQRRFRAAVSRSRLSVERVEGMSRY